MTRWRVRGGGSPTGGLTPDRPCDRTGLRENRGGLLGSRGMQVMQVLFSGSEGGCSELLLSLISNYSTVKFQYSENS